MWQGQEQNQEHQILESEEKHDAFYLSHVKIGILKMQSVDVQDTTTNMGVKVMKEDRVREIF